MLYLRCLLENLAAYRPLRPESGVTALEYGLIAALVAIMIIAGVALLGTNLSNVFNSVATTL